MKRTDLLEWHSKQLEQFAEQSENEGVSPNICFFALDEGEENPESLVNGFMNLSPSFALYCIEQLFSQLSPHHQLLFLLGLLKKTQESIEAMEETKH